MILRTDKKMDKWAETYRLFPFTVTCKDCGTRLFTDIPYTEGKDVGLVSDPCKCGKTIFSKKMRLWARMNQKNYVFNPLKNRTSLLNN